MSEVSGRCCWRCGRWGVQAFMWNWDHEMWECRNDRACKRRRTTSPAPSESPRESETA